MSAPPQDIPPARLFRILCGSPRPRLPLSLRLEAMPSLQLYVCGLRGQEELEAVDTAVADSPTEEIRISRILAELVVRSLYTNDEPLLWSADELGGLKSEEYNALLAEVTAGLQVVSPFYSRRTEDEAVQWDNVLELGARHPSNVNEMVLMAQAVQYGYGRLTPRPDLYWGLPLCKLTDGQLMAYRAAREVYRKLTNG